MFDCAGKNVNDLSIYLNLYKIYNCRLCEFSHNLFLCILLDKHNVVCYYIIVKQICFKPTLNMSGRHSIRIFITV